MKICSLFLFTYFSTQRARDPSLMIDLIIVSLILIVVILLLIIAFLTFYIIYEHRKSTVNSWKRKKNNEQRVVVPLLTLKTTDRSSGDHSNSASLISTPKRMTKRLRHRVKEKNKESSSLSSLVSNILHSYTKFSRFSSLHSTDESFSVRSNYHPIRLLKQNSW